VSHVTAYTLITALTWRLDGEPNHALLRRLAEDLEDALRDLPGTKDTELFGDAREEVRVEVDAERLAALGLSADDVARSLAAADAKVAAGQLRGDRGELMIEVEGELDSLARVGATPLRYGDGGEVLRVDDVARVRKTVREPRDEIALIDGAEAVAVSVRMESAQRVDRWAVEAHAVIDAFRDGLPRGVELDVVFDQSRYTQGRFAELLGNLAFAGLLVAGVIWLMMGWRSALVVTLALPLTSLMVLAGMKLLGVPLHQFSVTGLIIALGLLIDNAIVMVDEVRHRLGEGLRPLRAIERGVQALAVPLLGSTLTTALAFAPLLLMPGPAGEFVGALSVSVILAITGSLALSLTVLPALVARIERAAAHVRGARWWRDGVRAPALLRLHRAALGVFLRRPWLGVAFAMILPAAGFLQSRHLVEQFFPPAGRDQFYVDLRMPLDASLATTRARALEARELLLGHPRVRRVHWFVGGSAPKFYYNFLEGEDGTPSFAQALVQLDSGDGVADLIRALQHELDAALPHAQPLVRQLEQGPPFEAPVELRLFGPDVGRLHDLGRRLRSVLAEVPGVEHTRATLSHGRPKLWMRLDQDAAYRAGLDNVEIARQLDGALEGALGGSLLEATEELPVRVQLARSDRAELARIDSLQLRAPGRPVGAKAAPAWTPLSALGSMELRPVFATIPRRDGRRVNTVQGFTEAGSLPEIARADFERRIAAAGFALPPGYRMEFGGESAERDDAVDGMLAPAGLLALLMAGALVLSFDSFRMAAIIAAVAALSLGLALGALWLFGFPFGFMAIVGAMGLLGVAINDAIVVLAAIRDDEAATRGDPDAVHDVVVRSTRHVLATTITTMAGFTPLVLAGGGFWPPLAVAIGGGVVGATVLALYFVPSAFLLLTRRPAPVVA
jgi:multidrug efflux pump subunit AcrB